jgi:N-acetyl sugar amidotransferase
MSELMRCSRCLLPETHETITFDIAGICSVCKNSELKDTIDWVARKKELILIADENRGKNAYDCIVPFSGGKDSVWTLYYIVKELRLKPLVVSFDHGFYRPNLIRNRERVLKELGVESLIYTPNWKLVQRLMLQAFLEKGDFCWHCHTGIFSYPMWVAIEKKIPLVFWGEPSSEYASYYDYSEIELVDEDRFNRIINLGMAAEDMLQRLGEGFEERDLLPFTYPPARELIQLGVKSIPLGSYIPWDVKRQTDTIKANLGWTGDFVEGVPPEYDYEKIECYMQGVRDYIKFLKRGYARTTHLTSLDIRNNRISRTDALDLVGEFEGKRPYGLDLFLEYTGLTEKEFYEIAITHKLDSVTPPVNVKIGLKPPDIQQWQRHPSMPQDQKELALLKWRAER